MKKIISLVAAAAMLLSTTVFADVTGYIPEGCTTPKATVTCTKTAGPDSDGYYDYELNIDLSDMGKLSHTYASRKVTGGKLNLVSIELRGSKAMETAKTSISGKLGDNAVYAMSSDYTGADASGINIMYQSSDPAVAYPTSGETDKCDGAIKVEFYSKEGTITLNNAKIGFLYFDAGVGGEAGFLPLTLDKSTFTIGETTEPETIGVDATLLVSNDVAQEGITTNGYIWKVDLTNAASISDFKATFKAGEENAERKIRNMKALTAAMGGEGAYSFNVGLNTKKTGVTAKFEVTDGTNTAVWPAE